MKMWIKERILWWRCFYPVIFAHKPLCGPFHGHHLRVGKWHVCRSCLVLYAGAGLAAITFWLRPGLLRDHQALFAISVVLTLGLSYPSLYIKYPRTARDILRGLLGVSGMGILWLLIYRQWYWGLILSGVLWSVKRIYSTLRLSRREDVCQNCPEFHNQGICSGFDLKRRRMRLYERSLQRHLLTANTVCGERRF
ncbi:MAG: hypothetical protein K8I00_05470 [Candidatus Omnitrophica bacterium]|nr:hypothetical protein [Candidatus Omnitrophota bacterium]